MDEEHEASAPVLHTMDLLPAATAAERMYYPVRVGHSSDNVRDFRLPRNETRTTKYNPATFLPRFLFVQYKAATNVCAPTHAFQRTR